jgi:hypothetical protein
MSRGPGRPALPAGKAKASMFAVRLTDAERAAIDDAAKRANQPVTAWARAALLRAAQRDRGS